MFKNTRVFAQTLLDYLNGGDTVEDFPTVLREAAIQFLEVAREESHS